MYYALYVQRNDYLSDPLELVLITESKYVAISCQKALMNICASCRIKIIKEFDKKMSRKFVDPENIIEG